MNDTEGYTGREAWRATEEELNLFPEKGEYDDQSQKREYSYEKENQEWNRIMEMPDIVTTKSGKKIPNFRKQRLIRDFGK